MNSFDVASDTARARKNVSCASAGMYTVVETDDLDLNFSLVSLENKDREVFLQPRFSRAMASRAGGSFLAHPIAHVRPLRRCSHEPPTNDNSAEEETLSQRITHDSPAPLTDNGIGFFLPMRVDPSKNPFGNFDNNRCRQNCQLDHDGDYANNNNKINADEISFIPSSYSSSNVPQTPAVTPESVTFVPPPCRPGEYYYSAVGKNGRTTTHEHQQHAALGEQSQQENVPPPSAILLPEF